MVYFIIIVLSILWPGLGHIFIKKKKVGMILTIITLLNHILAFQYLYSTFFGYVLFGIVIYMFIAVFSIVNVIIEYRKNSISMKYKMLVLVVLIAVFFHFIAGALSQNLRFRTFKNITDAMANTLIGEDCIIADHNKNYKHSIHVGDIIVFDHLNLNFNRIFRVIALENDEIEIINDNVYVNNILINEPYKYLNTNYLNPVFSDYISQEAFNFPLTTIEKDKIFVLGDNRYNSRDSRFIGQIHKDFVVGKALYIYYSKDMKRIGKILR